MNNRQTLSYLTQEEALKRLRYKRHINFWIEQSSHRPVKPSKLDTLFKNPNFVVVDRESYTLICPRAANFPNDPDAMDINSPHPINHVDLSKRKADADIYKATKRQKGLHAKQQLHQYEAPAATHNQNGRYVPILPKPATVANPIHNININNINYKIAAATIVANNSIYQQIHYLKQALNVEDLGQIPLMVADPTSNFGIQNEPSNRMDHNVRLSSISDTQAQSTVYESGADSIIGNFEKDGKPLVDEFDHLVYSQSAPENKVEFEPYYKQNFPDFEEALPLASLQMYNAINIEQESNTLHIEEETANNNAIITDLDFNDQNNYIHTAYSPRFFSNYYSASNEDGKNYQDEDFYLSLLSPSSGQC